MWACWYFKSVVHMAVPSNMRWDCKEKGFLKSSEIQSEILLFFQGVILGFLVRILSFFFACSVCCCN